MISDLFDQFRTAIKIDEMRVKRPTQIFLCGGENPRPDNNEAAKSARHFFYRHLEQNQSPILNIIVLAETIVKKGALETSGFSDLLELERLVAEIVSVILLFVEGPGSFAELGAFTANSTILKRLVAVMDKNQMDKMGSFLFLGPIRRLLNYDERSLFYEAWKEPEGAEPVNADIAAQMPTNIVARLPELMKRNGETGGLSTHNGKLAVTDGEFMCIITGLLNIFHVLSACELDDAIARFATPSAPIKLNQYLFVLRTLGLIKREEYSHQWWYHSPANLVEWRYEPGSPFKENIDWMRHHRDEYDRRQTSDRSSRKRFAVLNRIRHFAGETSHG